MKCQNLCSGKIKKNVMNLSSAEHIAKRVVLTLRDKLTFIFTFFFIAACPFVTDGEIKIAKHIQNEAASPDLACGSHLIIHISFMYFCSK